MGAGRSLSAVFFRRSQKDIIAADHRLLVADVDAEQAVRIYAALLVQDLRRAGLQRALERPENFNGIDRVREQGLVRFRTVAGLFHHARHEHILINTRDHRRVGSIEHIAVVPIADHRFARAGSASREHHKHNRRYEHKRESVPFFHNQKAPFLHRIRLFYHAAQPLTFAAYTSSSERRSAKLSVMFREYPEYIQL